MNKIKLLILVKNIDGGTGTFLLDLLKISNYYPSIETRVIVLEKPSFRKIKDKRFAYLHRRNFYPYNYNLSIIGIYDFICDVLAVKKNVDNLMPDIVLGVDVHSNLLISLVQALFFKQLKTILTTHINLEETMEAKGSKIVCFILRRLINYFYNKAGILVCISRDLANDLRKNFNIRNKMNVIYYGISSPKKTRQYKNNSQKIILNIGRLVEQKDHKTLIEAFALLRKKTPEAKLWIVGDGPLKRNLKRLTIRLKLDEEVRFSGWITNIKKLLRRADILVLSSRREGFGYVLIEAMSYGLPIISTDTPFGPREILDNGKYGILVPMGDQKVMTHAMYDLLTDEKKYNHYSQKSLERIRDFSLNKMLHAYKKIILDLINEP